MSLDKENNTNNIFKINLKMIEILKQIQQNTETKHTNIIEYFNIILLNIIEYRKIYIHKFLILFHLLHIEITKTIINNIDTYFILNMIALYYKLLLLNEIYKYDEKSFCIRYIDSKTDCLYNDDIILIYYYVLLNYNKEIIPEYNSIYPLLSLLKIISYKSFDIYNFKKIDDYINKININNQNYLILSKINYIKNNLLVDKKFVFITFIKYIRRIFNTREYIDDAKQLNIVNIFNIYNFNCFLASSSIIFNNTNIVWNDTISVEFDTYMFQKLMVDKTDNYAYIYIMKCIYPGKFIKCDIKYRKYEDITLLKHQMQNIDSLSSYETNIINYNILYYLKYIDFNNDRFELNGFEKLDEIEKTKEIRDNLNFIYTNIYKPMYDYINNLKNDINKIDLNNINNDLLEKIYNEILDIEKYIHDSIKKNIESQYSTNLKINSEFYNNFLYTINIIKYAIQSYLDIEINNIVKSKELYNKEINNTIECVSLQYNTLLTDHNNSILTINFYNDINIFIKNQINYKSYYDQFIYYKW